MLTKADIRLRIGRQRKNLMSDERLLAGESAAERFFELDNVGKARLVSVFLSSPWEIPTSRIINGCTDKDKRLCVPAFNKSSGEYSLCEYTEHTQLGKGKFGTIEPVVPVWVDVSDVDVFVVPGIAFGIKGERVGQGGGHYDRILSNVSEGDSLVVGLAFDFQVIDCLPQDDWDVNVDVVVTDKRVINH